MVLADLASEALPAGVGGGVFGLLCALFLAMLRATKDAGERVDKVTGARVLALEEELDTARAEAKDWREKYLELRDRIDKLPRKETRRA